MSFWSLVHVVHRLRLQPPTSHHHSHSHICPSTFSHAFMHTSSMHGGMTSTAHHPWHTHNLSARSGTRACKSSCAPTPSPACVLDATSPSDLHTFLCPSNADAYHACLVLITRRSALILHAKCSSHHAHSARDTPCGSPHLHSYRSQPNALRLPGVTNRT